jgi:dTDP-4-amino-4,6-dideoxygalactose transaminase
VNTIPPFDLSQQFKLIGDEINQAVLQVLASGRYIGGAIVEGFEQQLADYVGTRHGISCNSGTDALYLALRAVGIGPGDEVITSPFTFIATAETISATGATPVFIDIDPLSFNLDLHKLEAAITPNTKAIVPVHLFGHPVDMTALMAIAQRHHLIVIEDCAQSAGADWGNQRTGSIGQVGCFSFYPTKNLGACGDGGAVTTNDPAIAQAIRVLRDHGRTGTYYHEALGVNSRLDAIQAAILSVKLPYLESWHDQRTQVAHRYEEMLKGLDLLGNAIGLPQAPVGGRSVWNQYTIRLKGATAGERDAIRQKLQAQGIICMVYYPIPLHLQPVYQPLGYSVGQLPIAEQAAQEVISLPMFPEMQPEQQQQVVYALKAVLA